MILFLRIRSGTSKVQIRNKETDGIYETYLNLHNSVLVLNFFFLKDAILEYILCLTYYILK